MGRFLLLLIVATSIGGTLIASNTQSNRARTAEARVETEEQVLARIAAETGFNIMGGLVTRHFAERAPVADVQVDEGRFGSYNAVVTESGRGPLSISIEGRYANTSHRILAENFPLTQLAAPLFVAGDSIKIELYGDDIEIRGNDHRQPGAVGHENYLVSGSGSPTSGMSLGDSTLLASVLDQLTDDQLERISGLADAADVSVERFDNLLESLYAEALAVGTVYLEGRTYSSETIGAPGDPAIIVHYGDVVLSGSTRGYGLLVVHGRLLMRNTSRWEGVVMVIDESETDGEIQLLQVELKDDAVIVGSLVLFGSKGFDGGHFDVDIYRPCIEGKGCYGGMKRAYHKHQYDDAYNVQYIDVLEGPGVDVYWRAFQEEYAGRTLTLELFNTTNGSGTIHLASPAGSAVISNCSSYTTTIIPDELTTLRPTFVDLSQLRATSPKPVQKDPVDRDGAYTVRIYDGSELVYAVSAYEHVKNPRPGAGCGTAPGEPDEDPEARHGNFNLVLADNSALYYSGEAIGQLGFALASIRKEWRIGGAVLSSSPIEYDH